MEKQNLGFEFELISPENYRQSVINTIVLLLHDIRNIEEDFKWTDLEIEVLNDTIERAKKELDNLKINKVEEDIKVIDLLNKIANGEEVPEKIKYYDEYYILNEDTTSIENLYLIDGALVGWFNHNNFSLNSQVQIIEEQEEIDIQSIEDIKDIFIENSSCGEDVKYLARKYNEILKWAKQLDKKTKEKKQYNK